MTEAQGVELLALATDIHDLLFLVGCVSAFGLGVIWGGQR